MANFNIDIELNLSLSRGKKAIDAKKVEQKQNENLILLTKMNRWQVVL